MESRIHRERAPAWKSPAPGVRVRPLVEGDGTTLMLYQLAPGTRYNVHSHPYPELGLIISGAGFFLVDEDERSAVGGDSYYFPANMPHGFLVPAGGEPVTLLDVSAAIGSELPPTLREVIARIAIVQAVQASGAGARSLVQDRPPDGSAEPLPAPAPSSRSRTPRPSH